MPSRSLFAKRSSTNGAGLGLLALPLPAAAAAAVVAGLGLALGSSGLAAAGLAALALAGAFAAYLIVVERRRHASTEHQLQDQARFLEALVASVGIVSDSRDPREILDRTCEEAQKLFRASAARVIAPDAEEADACEDEDVLCVALRAGDAPVGTLELRRAEAFDRLDVARATVLADFASRAFENARLIAEAKEREDERARLTERLITAEQDERRRLSIFLHDGPLQSMSGMALMHDAALAAIHEGRNDDAAKVIASSLERERQTIRTLRDLSFAIEPLVLRDEGFAAAVAALAEQVETAHEIHVSSDVAPGEQLAEKAQVALYQLVREALNQAVGRRPSWITVKVFADGGSFVTEIEDDGVGERRRSGVEELDERVRVLNGRVSVESPPAGGTTVRVVLPAYAAEAAS